MNRAWAKWFFAALIVLLIPSLLFVQSASSEKTPTQASGSLTPEVIYSLKNDLSPPLRDMTPIPPPEGPIPETEVPMYPLPGKTGDRPQDKPDPVVQGRFGDGEIPSPIQNFEGVDNVNAVLPPDTQGDVGPNHYVQWVKLSFRIYDKTGMPLTPIMAGSTLWAGFGGPCQTRNDGDPITLYDHLADRWLMSQFALPGGAAGFHQCIAISQTPDPTGAWYRYDFLYSATKLNDYPKFGVWPDAYYMTVNQFAPSFAGAGVMAFERDKMLMGMPAAAVKFDLQSVDPNFGGMLPSDLDGPPPPAGAPNYFAEVDDEAWIPGSPVDAIRLWRFHVDWATPANSTFGLSGLPNQILNTAPFVPLPCVGVTRDCIPQPGVPVAAYLDAIGDRLMHRLQYRNFGTRETLVVNHTVNAGGARAGVRWYEIRDPGGTPVIFQQGTYAPADTEHRWMGSIAMDVSGNIGLGYSVSSSTVFPSIRYTGRLAGDPPGELPQGEGEMIAGGGSQTHTASRWGDYSMMGVDPTDGCTFWFTSEYLAVTGVAPWRTRIASFKFPSCTTGPSGNLQGTVTDASTSLPIAGATVATGTFSTTTNASGFYQLANVPVGTYSVTASRYGYTPVTVPGVVISDGATTTQNFALTPATTTVVDGYVTDGSGAGWPLYARVQVSGNGFPGGPAFTDPVSGYYQLTIIPGAGYTYTVNAVYPGYATQTRPVTIPPGGTTQNFALTVNAAACNAPGYGLATALFEQFESGALPAGWAVTDNAGTGAVWRFDDPASRTNLTGGTGRFAIADSDFYRLRNMDTELRTPVLDLSSFAAVILEYNSDFNRFAPLPEEVCDTDVSVDGGTIWTNVLTRTGASFRGPRLESINITALAAGQSNVRIRFHYYNAFDEFWWEVDNVKVRATACVPLNGGLVVGNVYDGLTNAGLNGARVTHDMGGLTTTAATPMDPGLDDGFYFLFTPIPSGMAPATRTFMASFPEYGIDTRTVVPIPGGVLRQNFSLPRGNLSAAPPSLAMRLNPGQTGNRTLTLMNTGTRAANFAIQELNVPSSLSRPNRPGPFAEVVLRVPEKNQSDSDATRAENAPDPGAPVWPNAGEVISTFNTALPFPWGIGFNTMADDMWISDIKVGSPAADDKYHRFLRNGTNTGDAIDTTPFLPAWAADAAYDPYTNRLWAVRVGGDNGIYELDPVTKVATGNKIVPPFGTSERGLAYDPATDTFFAGSWNDFIIKRFNRAGVITQSFNVGLAVSGLAYNPATKHLFAVVNDDLSWDVAVLDVANNYSIIGTFPINGLGNFQQAGLEIDCRGRLWLVNQATKIVTEANSGEVGVCNVFDIPWLDENPKTGSVAPSGSQIIDVLFTTAGQTFGLKRAQLRIAEDTPSTLPNIPVNFTLAFLDVPEGSFGDNHIHGLAGAGVSFGCGGGNFCPNANLLRNAMAVWLLRGKEGGNYQPPPATGTIFGDVPAESFAADFIEEIARRGITAGCGGGNYCPLDPVNRATMSSLLLRALLGSGFVPPPPTGMFSDVPVSHPFAAFIEELARRGITVGCGGGRYCPDDPVTRAQMAIFVVRTFNLPVLP